MRLAWTCLLGFLVMWPGVAPAQKRQKPPEGASAAPAAAPTTDRGAGPKTKNYTFGGLDIEGRLKTPQLMYFLNRMKSEFDTTAPGRRSFLPELKQSTDEM